MEQHHFVSSVRYIAHARYISHASSSRPCSYLLRLPALTGHEEVKVVEQQHLEVEQDEAGRMCSMTMTSNPSLYVPGVGNTPIGDVVFHVYSTDDDQSCKVR